MMTTKEMFRARMKCRKTEPVRAKIYGLIVDAVQKNIRELDREETQADIEKATKKMYDQNSVTIEEYKKGNADTTELEAEQKILQEFIPKALSPEETEIAVKKIVESLPADDRTLRNIMPKLKDISGIDMKSAKNLVMKMI
ncbi:MAG: hypothetical protein BKP49_05640 [Treponema sp. CETP13]|nr:MAG: hypothetical protein BKP49_05640 [Treponema sp. CETP13]